MKKSLSLITIALMISACSVLSPYEDKAAHKAAKIFDAYCSETNSEFRASFRAEVNAKMEKGSVVVECQ